VLWLRLQQSPAMQSAVELQPQLPERQTKPDWHPAQSPSTAQPQFTPEPSGTQALPALLPWQLYAAPVRQPFAPSVQVKDVLPPVHVDPAVVHAASFVQHDAEPALPLHAPLVHAVDPLAQMHPCASVWQVTNAMPEVQFVPATGHWGSMLQLQVAVEPLVVHV
jgi:hypothetical protein